MWEWPWPIRGPGWREWPSPSWCSGHLKGISARIAQPPRFSSPVCRWVMLKQPIRGGQVIYGKIFVSCKLGRKTGGERGVLCGQLSAVKMLRPPSATHGLCLLAAELTECWCFMFIILLGKKRQQRLVCSFGGLSVVFCNNWHFHKELAKYMFMPRALEYSKIIVSLYLSGCF